MFRFASQVSLAVLLMPTTTDSHIDDSPLFETSAGVAGSGGDPAAQASASDKVEMAGLISTVQIKHPLGPGPFSLDDFELGVTLGTGSFGRVRIATHKTTQTPWAIKILKKAEIVRMQQVRKSRLHRETASDH